MTADIYQIRKYIVIPALEGVGFASPEDVQLVLATGMVESLYEHVDQKDRTVERPGPAYGPFQMEQATHDDLWTWLGYRRELAEKVRRWMILGQDNVSQMQGNWYYAAIMCRLLYFRVPQKLPPYGDALRMAQFWKRYYNTEHGSGTIQGFLQKTKTVFDMKN